MIVELTKEMAIHMVKGTQPSYDVLPFLTYVVDYSDQYGRYYWHTDKLEKMEVSRLLELYKLCTKKDEVKDAQNNDTGSCLSI